MAKGTTGNANVNLTANTAGFQSGLKKATQSVQRFKKSSVNLQRQLKKIGSQMQSIGKSMTTSITLPAVAAGGLAVKTFADFEQQMAKVRAVSGAAGKTFEDLEKLALDLGKSTRFTASEVAELQLNYAKLGFIPDEIQKITASTLDLALATGEDLADSAEVAGGILRAFGKDASEMPVVVDVMAKSFSSSALNLEKFKDSMKTAAPVANAVGASLQDTVAVISSMVDANLDASTAGTTLRNMFLELADKGISWQDAMDQIRNSTNKAKTANDLFGKRAVAGALIIADNTEKIDKLSKAYNTAEGTAKTMAGIMDDTLNGALLRMKSAIEGAAIEFGKTLKPAVDFVATAISKLANKFTALEPKTKKIIAVIVGVAAAIGPLLVAVGTLLPLIGSIGPVIAALAGPFGWAAIAIAAAGAFIVTHWEEVKATFNFIAKSIVETLDILVNTFDTKVSLIGKESIDGIALLKSIWDGLYNSIVANLTITAKTVLTIFIGMKNGIKAVMGLLRNIVDMDWAGAWQSAKDIVGIIFGSMITIIENGVSIIIGLFGELISFFTDEWDNTIHNAKSEVSNLADLFRSKLPESAQKTKEEVESVADSIANAGAEAEKATGALNDLAKAKDKVTSGGAPSATGSQIGSVGGEISGGDAQAGAAIGPIIEPEDIKLFREYSAEIQRATDLSRIFGVAAGDLIDQKLSITEQAISEAVDAHGEQSTVVQELIQKYKELGREAAASAKKQSQANGEHVQKMGETINQVNQFVAAGASAATAITGQTLRNQEIMIENRYAKEMKAVEESQATEEHKAAVLKTLEENMAKEKSKIRIKEAKAEKASAIMSAIVNTAAGVASALSAGPSGIPLALVVGALGAAQIATIAAQPIPEFAQGGLVSAPTVAMVGDNVNARHDPEVISPLSKLKKMIGMPQQELVTRISGQDIELVLSRRKRGLSNI